MSSLGSIGGTSSPYGTGALDATRSETNDRFGEISSEEFIELILTELTTQDPTEPRDTQALLDQIGAIRSIESDTAMIDRLGELVTQSSFTAGANLIGAVVYGRAESGELVTDLVASVSRSEDGPILNLIDGSRIRMENLFEASAPLSSLNPDPEPEAPAPTDETGGDDGGGGADGDTDEDGSVDGEETPS